MADAAAPTTSARSERLDAVAYSSWVRSLQKKLFAARAAAGQPESAAGYRDEELQLVDQLLGAFGEYSSKLALRSDEWELWSALVLYQGAASNADSEGVMAAPLQIQSCIDVHLKATQDGAGMDWMAFARHTSLLLTWHLAYVGLTRASLDDDEEMDDGDNQLPLQANDFLKRSTEIVGGPAVEQDGTYVAPSLPRVLARTQVQDEELLRQLDSILGEEAVRNSLREAYSRMAYHIPRSQTIWEIYLSFEMTHLQHDSSNERKELVKQSFLSRVRVPHKQHDETSQRLSAFVSNNFSAEEYEGIMETASKGASSAKTAYTERERWEDQLEEAQTSGKVSLAKAYLRWESSRRPGDRLLAATLYARIIHAFAQPPTATAAELQSPPTPEWEAQFAKERSNKPKKDAGRQADRVELAARATQSEDLWEDYLSYLAIQKDITAAEVIDACTASIRALPGSGKLWAIYLRSLARNHRGEAEIVEAFSRALAAGQCEKDVTSLAELLLGRCDAEKELVLLAAAGEQGVPIEKADLTGDTGKFSQVFAVAESCFPMLAGQRNPDPEVRLERFLSGWCERFGAETAILADSVWDSALRLQQTNSKAWYEGIQYCIRTGQVAKARSLFKQISGRPGVENRTQLLDAWTTFEHVYGSSADILYAQRKVKMETEKAWAAYYKQYSAQQQYQPASIDAAASTSTATTNGKRAAEDKPSHQAHDRQGTPDASKRNKMQGKPKTKDRENCSVLVSQLPADSTDLDLRTLFRGCGTIVDISGPRQVADGSATALVEFDDREAVPAARTRDKKQVRGAEVAVHVGHECTLYVTNFPEETTDEDIRARFGQYGSVFDVRWPSKKFSSSRRFCYVELTTPDSAKAALHENGRKLSDLHTLQVALSDPNRRKQRTDAHANERELYVTGLPHNAIDAEVRALFEPHGTVEGFRMPSNDAGKVRGIAFVDYSTPLEAQKAVAELNGAAYGGKSLKVTIANKGSNAPKLGGAQGFRSRAVRLRGLPDDAQEALIQQLVERVTGLGSVKKVEWTPGPSSGGEAIVELQDPPTAGKLLLTPNLTYAGSHALALSSLESAGAATAASLGASAGRIAPTPASATAFAPRVAQRGRAGGRGRGRGGIGFVPSRPNNKPADAMETDEQTSEASTSGLAPKGQDAFRAMLR